MAKKAKKPAAKPSKKASKPATKKSAGKKPAGKKAAPKRDPLAPIPVSTGGGMTPAEVGKSLVEMFNAGQMKEIEEKWWNPSKITSVEGVGVGLSWVGKKAVDAKNAGWMAEHAIHGASAEGPFVGSSGFAVKFKMDVETRSTGHRSVMEEVGVYTVENGKIVREEFMYMMP